MGFQSNNNSSLAKEENRINSLQYEQSTFGTTKQVLYGTNMICGNLIDNTDFTPIAHSSSQGTGKGGGGGQSSVTYTYKSRCLIGLCYGQVDNIKKVEFDDGIYSLNQLNMTFFNGSPSQNKWGEMASLHSDHALNYRHLAYVAGYIDLTSSGGVPQYNFEVAGKCLFDGIDANPKDIALDVLTNAIYGAGFPSKYIDFESFETFSQYCIANNVLLSPVYDAQEEVQKLLTELFEICNSTFIWTQGKLKAIPLCDEKIAAHGASYIPDLTPVYDFDEDDFIDDDEPVICNRTDQNDIFNSVKIEYKNRANSYATEVVEAQDLANIELFGVRAADTQKAHQICRTDIAQNVAQLALDRNIAVRNTYTFKVPFRFIMLDPMDIVTITYPRLGLVREPVRIKSIKESDMQLEIEAEEMVIGSANPAKIDTQEASFVSIDANQTVGNVNPVIIFEPPMELTQNTLEVWVGVSSRNHLFGGCEIYISDDGATYRLLGKQTRQCRQGIVKNIMGVSENNPDVVNSLVVDVSMSNAELLSGTQQDAERLNTLCWVNGEFLAYKNAELDDLGTYRLSYLNRGAYGSEIKQHNKDEQFVRIDTDAFMKIPFSKDDIGKEIFIKCPTFNSFGAGIQTQGDVSPYSYKIQGTALKQAPENVTGLTNYYSDGLNIIKWQPVDDARNIVYEIRKGSTWGKAQCLGRISQTTFTANGNGTYWVKAFAPEYNTYSVEPASLEITGARLVQNVIEVIDEKAEGFKGHKTPSMFVDEYGILSLAGVGKFSEIELLSQVSSVLFFGGIAKEGIYDCEKIVDIGAASRCYIHIEYNFLGENPFSTFSKIPKLSEVEKLIEDFGEFITNSRVQIAIAQDEEFSSWQDFVTGQYYGRKFKFRVILNSSSDNVVAKMNKLTINVDVPDLVETGNSILIPAEGLRINFAKHFHDTPNLQVTILNKEVGDDETITNLNAVGFDIQLKNNNEMIAKYINFVAQGY